MSHIPQEGVDATCERVSKPKNLLAIFVATFALVAGFPVQADDASYHDLLVNSMYPHEEIELSINELTEIRMQELRESLKQSAYRNMEEIRVTAVDLSKQLIVPVNIHQVKVGLEGKVLIHTYDKRSDSWKLVKADISG